VLARSENVTDTERADDKLTVQTLPLDESHPSQLDVTEPESGHAVNVTVVPFGRDAEHDALQDIPLGLLVTPPVPFPPVVTNRVEVCEAACMVTEAVPYCSPVARSKATICTGLVCGDPAV
jgi:hypothetical protein